MLKQSFRLPGMAITNPLVPPQRTHEWIHRSVFQLTFPFTTDVIPPSPPNYPLVIAPCWSLKGVVPTANPADQARTWVARLEEGRQGNQVRIEESTALPEESALVRRRVDAAHKKAEDESREWYGEATENPLLTILPGLFQL